mmetsp:Transcript_44780/g.101364  ORF Transcript_44780/g.101364 Transcript_44780/m.101364 type:complete len:251 (-) Transcript_44780:2451-3203(-)
MVTSQASNPAAWTTQPISRSPLLPSSRRTATFSVRSPAGVGLGSKVSLYAGGSVASSRTFLSDSAHAGAHCRASSWKEVASHTSRSLFTVSLTNTCSPCLMTTRLSPVDFPIVTGASPAAVNLEVTVARWSGATSRTNPGASSKAAVRTQEVAPGIPSSTTSTPTFPANAISNTATRAPPSDRSCPARISRPLTSSCTTANPRFSAYACANAVFTTVGATSGWCKETKSRVLSVPFKSGVTVSRISGHGA